MKEILFNQFVEKFDKKELEEWKDYYEESISLSIEKHEICENIFCQFIMDGLSESTHDRFSEAVSFDIENSSDINKEEFNSLFKQIKDYVNSILDKSGKRLIYDIDWDTYLLRRK